MPNPLRAKVADDEDLVVVMADIFQDDTSGNVSKQWDKHLVTCVRNGNLPGRLLQQEFNVKFVSSSQHATCAEQFAAIRDMLKSTEDDPIRCYNVHTKKKTAVVLRAPGLPGDNPQQSEESSHIGCNGNHPCRKCEWGGTTIEKTSEQVYHNCHLPVDVKRTAQQTRERLQDQLALAARGDAKTIKERQTSTGTKDKLTQYWIDRVLAEFARLRDANPGLDVDALAELTQTWLDNQPGDKINPLLDITGLDPSQDTPVELLHTVLLGVVKYIWHFLNTKQWSDTDRALLAIRLQSTDVSGLTIPPIRAFYLVQYRNSLIGKHFKTLMQTLAFVVHDICTPEQFRLIKAAGDLGARLWIPEIDDMELYLADLKTAIANLLDAFDAVDPLRILVKIKLHLLAHLPDDIRRFGPAIRFATEIFESCNAIFRACSVRSNRLSPSRDIATKFAAIERVRHMLCGGCWYEPKRKIWVQAGQAVLALLHEEPVFQRHLGWVPPKPINAGQTRLASERKQPSVAWSTTRAASYSKANDQPAADSLWRLARTIVAQNGDILRPNSWVYALDAAGSHILGRVAEILVGSETVVTIEQFLCTEQLHEDFGWPVVRRPRGEDITRNGVESFVVLKPNVLQFMCSVQHDCSRGRCKPTVSGRLRQEREETTKEVSLIRHADDEHFILNMAGLHNFVELRRILPASFTTLKPLHEDRRGFHNETAAKAKQLRMTNREKAAEKRRIKAAEKKRLAEAAAVEAQAEDFN
ncbi:FAD-binding-3 domain-containing protein [Mycena chlorophos]|uniref:FAD-binding-3 domain-containing protein n=1 Tax=Mycena chlorophos TaxID=658473 RepID=A0A8H6TI00_MYCCL|nr:FAD-binding-3 domain-containing protein [Mycena chlorophos]